MVNLNKVISWIGTVTSILGSFLVAFHLFVFGYIFFLIGSVCWFVVGFWNSDRALMVLNGVFFAANIIGLINAF